MKLCVIGDPVGHSMSPVLHRRMLALSGIEGDYQAVTVTRETLPDFMAAGRSGEWDGCNVTMPLKQEVIRYLDQLPQAARQCRVVVNATPLGMEGFPPFADLSFLGSLPAGAAVFDLIYAPRKTELYQAARARGLIAITGMELLVQQAILAFNHFTGAGLEQEATRRELLALVNET